MSEVPLESKALQDIARLLADLAGEDDIPPPPTLLRTAVLEAARSTAIGAALPERDTLPADARAYRDQIEALEAVLDGIEARDVDERGGQHWPTPVAHGWTPVQVLGHLLAVDSIAAAACGLPTPVQAGTGRDPAARTAAVHSALAGRPLADWRRIWRAQAVALLRHAVARGEAGMRAPVPYLSIDLAVGDVLLDRAFETWIHAEDLRTVLDRPTLAPQAADVARLADLGVRFMPYTWPDTGPDGEPAGAATSGGSVAFTLTGPGGGVWTITPGAPVISGARGGVAATVELDVLDFCRLAGGRLAPQRVAHVAHGDAVLANHALEAAAALARL